MKVSLINPNPTNDEIYDTTDVSSLAKSIEDNGLLEPLVISRDGVLISGHRRLAAVKSLGWEDVEVHTSFLSIDLTRLRRDTPNKNSINRLELPY